MNDKKYKEIRSKFKEYALLQKELKCRTEYIEDFRRFLIKPMANSEGTLLKIYNIIITEMEEKAEKLRKRLVVIEKVIDQLEGPEKNIMYYRYIMGISWVKLPEYMMYEQRTCQMFESKAMEKIKKMSIDWENEYVE